MPLLSPNLPYMSLREVYTVANLDSTQQRLKEAQKTAKSRATRERVGPDWPRVDGISSEEALEEVTLQMLLHDARLSFGNTEGSADIWGRLAFPINCDSQFAGKVAFMTSSTVDGALRKLAQCTTGDPGHGVWKEDRFARP